MEGIGDLATSWRTKGASSIYFVKLSHLDYHIFIIYPLLLLAVTWTQLIYIKSYLPICICWFRTLHVFCICCASYLLNLRNQVYSWMFACHIYVCVWAYIASCSYLSGSFERLMDYPIVGKCDVLWTAHNPNNVCTWGIPLRIDIARLSSLYVVCHSHEKFKFYNDH